MAAVEMCKDFSEFLKVFINPNKY